MVWPFGLRVKDSRFSTFVILMIALRVSLKHSIRVFYGITDFLVSAHMGIVFSVVEASKIIFLI